MLHEQLGYNKNSTENIEDSFPKLFKFCERMDIIMKKLNTAVALYKNRKEPTINIEEIIEVPEELLHFEWKNEEDLRKALENFKQRNAVLLEGKVKYSSTNTYAQEPRIKRYK